MTTESEQPGTDPGQIEAFRPLPGELLLAAREARGVSPERVAESLNLDVSVVLALENNRFDELGAPVFARGHLRKYARLLNLDPKDVLRAYDAIVTEQSGVALTSSPGVTEVSAPVTHGWLKPLILLLAILALAVVLWKILTNGDVSLPGRETSVASAKDLSPVSGPSQSRRLPVPDRSTQPQAEVRPQPTAGRETDSEAEAAPQTPTISPEPAAAQQSRPRAVATRAASPGGEMRVVFAFKRDSWIEVRDAVGRRLVNEMGRSGRRSVVTGRGPFRVLLGYVEGVEVQVDGEAFAVPLSSIRGNTARFSIQSPAAASD